jgi:integrase
VRQFLSALAVEERVAASTQNQALAALTFLYDGVLQQPLERVDGIAPAHRSRHVPVVLSETEIRSVLRNMADPARLCAALMYGSGVRLLECLQLRIKDIDCERRELVVRGGKGDKDRRAPLAESWIPALTKAIGLRRVRYDADRRGNIRTGGIAESLRRKYPTADGEWRWQYLFGARRTYRDSSGVGAVITCTRLLFNGHFATRSPRAESRSERRATRCVIRSRRTCWRTARTFEPCRSFLGIATFGRQ